LKQKQNNNFFRSIIEESFYVPAILFLAVFLVRFGFLVLSDNFKGPQPMLNIATSLHIFNFPSILENVFYQPLPLFLYSLFCAVKIAGDQIVSGRLLSVFLGAVSVIPFYYLSKRLFNKKIALFSSMLFCFYPEHIVNSVITMPDVLGLVFLMGALYYVEDQRIVLSAVLLGFGTACAYICWFFVPIMPVYIILTGKGDKRLKLKNVFSFLFIAVLFPFFWIILINNKYGAFNLFYNNFFESQSLLRYCFDYMQNVSALVNRLFMSMPLLFLLSLAGMYQSAKARRHYHWGFLIGSLLLAASSGLFREEIPVLKEGVFIISILFLPFAVLGVDFILSVVKLKSNWCAVLAVVLICVNFLFVGVNNCPYLPRSVKKFCLLIPEKMKSKDTAFYISYNNPYYSSIMMLSGIPQGNFHYYGNEFSNLEMRQSQKTYFIYYGDLKKNILKNFRRVIGFGSFAIIERLDSR